MRQHGWIIALFGSGCSDYELQQINLLIPEDDSAVGSDWIRDPHFDTGIPDWPWLDDPDDSVLEDDRPRASAPIYLNTSAQLWSWDPREDTLLQIGPFTGIEGVVDNMTDIAIDGEGRMYGCTHNALFQVDPETAVVERVGNLPFGTTGLTFVSDDLLIAAGDGAYVIDAGRATISGVLVQQGVFTTAGDLVGLPDGLLYWTVLNRSGSGDQLVIVNPNNRNIALRGELEQVGVWGMAYADGVLYGFQSGGHWLAIDPRNGGTSMGSFDRAASWWGAATNPIQW
ncbi:MAG: hypothetical protein AAFV53_35810 [Myxococcota bacterium]